MPKPPLLVDFVGVAAARAATSRWHYSGSLPASKKVCIGAWEGDRFIGVVVFAQGANPNSHRPFGISPGEVAELCRVALRAHDHPVSRIVAVAVKLLRRQSPDLRLLLSYADPVEGHHGGIYQAMNWTYLGLTTDSFEYRVGTRRVQKRAYTGRNYGSERAALPKGARKVTVPGKHRYALGLDRTMKHSLGRIAEPYPARSPVL